MELFTVQCTTCRARLKVNDPRVIGDILACPKCGSMVQIVPPSDAQGPSAQSSENNSPSRTTETKTSRLAGKKAAATPPVLPARSSAASSSSSLTASSIGLPPLPKPKAGTASAQAAATPMPLADTPTMATATATAQHAATPAMESPSRGSGDWKLLAAGLLGGVALGAVAWIVLGLLLREPEAAVAVAPQATPVPSSAVERAGEAPGTPAAEIEATVVASDHDTAATAPSEAELSAPGAAPPAEQQDSSAPEAASEAAGAKPAEKVERPAAGIKLEPAEPEKAAPQGAARPSHEDEPAPPPLAERPLSDPHAPRVATDESSGAPAARALTADEIDERLSGPLPKVRFTKVPLAQFVAFIGDFSGLEIVIDERALAKVSKSRETPVTVKLADTTARDALRSAVNSLGLTCVVRDGQLVITAVQK